MGETGPRMIADRGVRDAKRGAGGTVIEGNRERAWSARGNGKRGETRVGRRSGQRFGGARFGKVRQADGRRRRKHLQSTSFCFQGLKASSSTKMLRDQEPTVLARDACSRQARDLRSPR